MLRKFFGKNKLEEPLALKADLIINNEHIESEVINEKTIEYNDNQFLDLSPIEDFKYVIAYDKVNVEIVKYLGNDVIVKVPDEIEGMPVKEIRSSAFEYNKILEKIYLPRYLQVIGDSAFRNCINLKKVHLNDNLERIEKYAFCDSGVEYIKIPEKVKIISESIFRNCTNLINIKLNESIEVIEYGAFNSSSIQEVVLPSNIRKIEDFAFGNCANLTKITLNYGLESIGTGAFNKCKIECLKIPKTVKSIGDLSFSNCNNLQSLEIVSHLENIGTAAFNGCNKLNSKMYEFLVEKYGYINEEESNHIYKSSYRSKCKYEEPENRIDRMDHYEYVINHE